MTTKEKERKFHIGRFLFVLVLLCAIGGAVYFALPYLWSSDYSDQASFERYARYKMKENGENKLYDQQEILTYGEPLSYAARLPQTGYPGVDQAINQKYEQTLAAFEKTDKHLYKDDRAAIIVSGASNAVPGHPLLESLAMHTIVMETIDGNETITHTVDCYNVSSVTKEIQTGYQIFDGDYQSLYWEALKEAIPQGDAPDGQYTNDFKKFVDNFYLGEDGVTYFVNPGNYDSDQEIISFTIPYEKYEGILRENAGSRIIDPNKPMVALTFDDGPNAECTPVILDVCEKYNVVVTFFEIGSRIETEQGADKILKRELELGCEIGTNGYSGNRLTDLEDAALKKDAQKSMDATEKACGQKPTVLRAPYGECNDKICQTYGLSDVNWDVDSLDWQSNKKDAIVSKIKGVDDLDGCIVLMHSIYLSTAQATEEIVPYLLEEGYQLVTVSEMMQYRYGKDISKPFHYGYRFTDK